ncbi:MAG: type II toxin-antitoxin system YafQ family toxin [Clostridia bacterium]|nr:type II toxin-antitoxin system YafQ family toxin [Clostridia bacterium]
MKYEIKPTGQFKKDLKKVGKRNLDLSELKTVIETLAEGKALAPKYRDHELGGDYKKCRECHIQPDWLLIYRYQDTDLILYLLRTGTHSDLF